MQDYATPYNLPKSIKYLELCAGIGGFRYALNELSSELEVPMECIGYSEIDKYAIKLYSAYYKDERNLGDVTKINADNLPDFDLLVGGFPCQAFSIAGHRKGFDDTRGTIFFDFLRILKAKRPKYFLFENVKGLINHDGGNTLKVILEALDDAGYETNYKLYNTKDYGLPQNRERIYISGFLRTDSRSKILCERKSSAEISKLRGQEVITNTITARYAGCGNGSYIIENKQPAQTQCDTKNTETSGSEVLSAGLIRLGDLGSNSQANRVYSADGISQTLSALGGGGGAKTGLYKQDLGIRKLTPRECFRLQGFAPFKQGEQGLIFDDSFVNLGYEIGISDSQLYKMAGNAVSTPVVKAAFIDAFA